jgi:hypothetical protein
MRTHKDIWNEIEHHKTLIHDSQMRLEQLRNDYLRATIELQPETPVYVRIKNYLGNYQYHIGMIRKYTWKKHADETGYIVGKRTSSGKIHLKANINHGWAIDREDIFTIDEFNELGVNDNVD